MLLYSVKENLSEKKLKQNKKTFKDSKLKIVEGVQVFNRKLKNCNSSAGNLQEHTNAKVWFQQIALQSSILTIVLHSRNYCSHYFDLTWKREKKGDDHYLNVNILPRF